jgi:hypothetical protein
VTARWFRVEGLKAGWDGHRHLEGLWHLVIVRSRFESGRRIFGAACSPTRLQTTGYFPNQRRSVRRTDQPPADACPRCLRVYERWPRLADGRRLRRPWHIRRTVCGPACGGWTPREHDVGDLLPCSGWHRNKRLWCEADAKWAITSVALIGRAKVLGEERPKPFYRCTYCARGYREGWLGEFVVERLMGDPPKELVA